MVDLDEATIAAVNSLTALTDLELKRCTFARGTGLNFLRSLSSTFARLAKLTFYCHEGGDILLFPLDLLSFRCTELTIWEDPFWEKDCSKYPIASSLT